MSAKILKGKSYMAKLMTITLQWNTLISKNTKLYARKTLHDLRVEQCGTNIFAQMISECSAPRCCLPGLSSCFTKALFLYTKRMIYKRGDPFRLRARNITVKTLASLTAELVFLAFYRMKDKWTTSVITVDVSAPVDSKYFLLVKVKFL